MEIKNLIINEKTAEVFPCTNRIHFENIQEFYHKYKFDILINRIEQLNEWYDMKLDYNFEIGMNDSLLVRMFNIEKNFNTGLYNTLEMLYLIDGMFCMKSFLNNN